MHTLTRISCIGGGVSSALMVVTMGPAGRRPDQARETMQCSRAKQSAKSGRTHHAADDDCVAGAQHTVDQHHVDGHAVTLRLLHLRTSEQRENLEAACNGRNSNRTSSTVHCSLSR